MAIRTTYLAWVAIVCGVAMVLVVAPTAVAAMPLAAPPASPRAIQHCSAQAAASAATADVEREVRGVGTMSGCITDATGIAHLFVDWETADGSGRGRICVDPIVRNDSWSCTWDTTLLEPGSYTVTLMAVDAAGNRGTSHQAYRIEAPVPDADEPLVPEPDAPMTTPEEADPAPAPDAEPVDPGASIDPTSPLPVEPVELEPVPATPETLVQQLVADRVEECGRLELAPDVRADRALSVAVLECMRPAFEALGATTLGLDEIPVPPAIRIDFPDARSSASADELLPDRIGGVELQFREPASPAPDG